MRNATLAQLVREAELSVEERNPAWPADRGDKWRWRSVSPELAAYVAAAEHLRVYVVNEDSFEPCLREYDLAAMTLFLAIGGNP